MEAIPPYQYIKVRGDFGYHPSFDNSATTVMESIAPSEGGHHEWFKLIEQTVNLDCIPQMAMHEVKAKKVEQVTTGSAHQDGAWPTDIKKYDVNDKAKLRKREKTTDIFKSSVVALAQAAELIVEQNNAIDLFEDYFQEEDAEVEASEPASAKTVAVFRDPNDIKRQANMISWHPEGPNKLAVAYSILHFQQMPSGMAKTSYVWDVNNPNEPDIALTPQSELVCLEYNPRSPDQLIGGSYNGMVSFWDLRKGGTPTMTTVIEQSHHDPVLDVRWMQSRLPHEAVSVSSGGRLMWWDIRKLNTGPMDQMWLQESKTTWGGCSIGYSPSAGHTKYLVGTEQGMVINVDRKTKKDADAESTKTMKVFGQKAGRHHGPVYSVERNPVAPKYFLTIGDWTARVWMDDSRQPIMTTKYDKSYLTAGCWSPTRPGVFFTTKADGTLDVWDYYFKQNDPTFSTKVSDSGLRSIRVQNKGRLLALGSEDGTTTVLQISKSLATPASFHEEKSAIQAMFEREAKRERHLEAREVKRKNKKKNKNPEPAFDPYEDEPDKVQKVLDKVEKDFYRQLKIEEPKKEEKEKEGEEEKKAG